MAQRPEPNAVPRQPQEPRKPFNTRDAPLGQQATAAAGCHAELPSSKTRNCGTTRASRRFRRSDRCDVTVTLGGDSKRP